LKDEPNDKEEEEERQLNIKMLIKIEKSLMKKVFTVVDLSKFEDTNQEATYNFIGQDVNETVAKAKAAQLALEQLFDIKLNSPGNLVVFILNIFKKNILIKFLLKFMKSQQMNISRWTI